jgi:two-component system chemotaxis sensor kinase CheA
MVELIADPLMHLVRNAADHGIEAKELRQQLGKPARGRLSLNAYHDSGSVVIEVADDGGGLNRDKIRSKALDRGLITPEQVLEDPDIYRLIFEPGFSTAEAVTNLSGRGVGMDVVKKNIEALRGTIDIDSQPGAGTCIKLRLPLTLAIIDGFLVELANAHYVVPLDMLVECMDLGEEEKLETQQRGFINLRGSALPILHLRDLFAIDGRAPARENVVVVDYGGQRAGLAVDRLLGQLQVVIKPLPEVFKKVRGIGGSTILGDGTVAMILDIPSLIQLAASAVRPEATAVS